MDIYKIKKLCADYSDELWKISLKEIWEKLTVRGTGLSRKIVQQAYKEMKKPQYPRMKDGKFRGDIIDHICFVYLLDVVANVALALEHKVPIKKFSSYLQVYFVLNVHIFRVVCRLVLKDDTYINDAFNHFKISENDKMRKEVKDILILFTNSLLQFKPKESSDSKRLKRS